MACVITFSLPLESHAAARLRNGSYWANKQANVYFQLQDLSGEEKVAVRAAMNTWNAVKNFSGNKMITFYDTTNPSTAKGNRIYTITDENDGFMGKCNRYPGSGAISYVEIYINRAHHLRIGATSGYHDFQSVVVHELGHALGVAHCHEQGSTCSYSTCSDFVMNPNVPTARNRRTLTSYDKSSYQVIYD